MKRPPGSCLILGSGMAGIALGALLARAGVKVTILEGHPELIGGCAQTLDVNGYRFTVGPRYLWGFGPGEIGQRFLQKCDLTEKVPLIELDRKGFDHLYLGDCDPIQVPNGWDDYEQQLLQQFPKETTGIRQFFELCRKAFRFPQIIEENELHLASVPEILWNCFRKSPRALLWTLMRRNLTLAQVFRKCGLSPMLRTVLYGHGGVFAQPVEQLSFFAYVAGTLLYHQGCHYPQNDMTGFLGELRKAIEDHNGTILTDHRVVSVEANRQGIRHVKTQNGEAFTAETVVVNFDPRTFLGLIDNNGESRIRPLPRYEYSMTCHSLFLGVNQADLLKPVFGPWNIWYWPRPDQGPELFPPRAKGEPLPLYLGSPTLQKGVNNDAPPGHATIVAYALCRYEDCRVEDPDQEEQWKEVEKEAILDSIEKRFIPGLRDHLEAIHLRTPLDKERAWLAPKGNIYGRSYSARDIWVKLPYKGLLPNLYFVGAYVAFAGIPTMLHAASKLYKELTGDPV